MLTHPLGPIFTTLHPLKMWTCQKGLHPACQPASRPAATIIRPNETKLFGQINEPLTDWGIGMRRSHFRHLPREKNSHKVSISCEIFLHYHFSHHPEALFVRNSANRRKVIQSRKLYPAPIAPLGPPSTVWMLLVHLKCM